MLKARFRRRTMLATLVLLNAVLPLAAAETALDRYVKKPDPTYKYELVRTIPGEGYTTYILDLTSQTWRSPSEVDRTVWKHWLTIVKPDEVSGTTGFMFISGGSVTAGAPARAGALAVQIATTTHNVTAELRGIPNEPLQFADETRKRNEDEIIVYTWNKFLTTGDETWPLRLPMTKAAVRAMDTITAFVGASERGNVKVEKFVVSGGSKRGWTTWATAAVDKRVVAIIPASIDTLNVQASFQHHWKVYGFWAPAVKDYQEGGIMDWIGTREYDKLMAIEDPYSYRDRLTLPKYMVQAAGDQYFLPDASRFYFDDLKGEKYLRYVPNTDHSLRDSDAEQSLASFYETVAKGTPRPQFTWSLEKNGDIKLTSKTEPSAVKLWQATNPEHRDFRLESLGPKFTSTDLQGSGGTWTAHVAAPAKGWTAFFIEATYPGPGKSPLKFTTGVRVTPDTEPFPAYVAKPHPPAQWH